MGRILQFFKEIDRAVKNGEHLKPENLHTREELAEIQLRRGKWCLFFVVAEAVVIIPIQGFSVEEYVTNMLVVILSLAGISGIAAGLYNRHQTQ